MNLLRSQPDPARKSLGAALRENRTTLSQALYSAVRTEECATWKVPQQFEQVEEWGRAHLLTAVDLLIAWYETGDVLYEELFAGWVHSRLVPDLSQEGTPADYKPDAAVRLAKAAWTEILQSAVSGEAIQALQEIG